MCRTWTNPVQRTKFMRNDLGNRKRGETLFIDTDGGARHAPAARHRSGKVNNPFARPDLPKAPARGDIRFNARPRTRGTHQNNPVAPG